MPGESAGTCAAAFGPTSYLITGDQWIVCVGGRRVRPRCYRQREHGRQFRRPQPIRASPFDANCHAALSVLEKAGILP